MFRIKTRVMILLLFGSAWSLKRYDCQNNNEVLDVEAEINEAFFLSSYDYPSTTDQACSVRIYVSEAERWILLVQYIHASYNGTINYRTHDEQGRPFRLRSSSGVFTSNSSSKSDTSQQFIAERNYTVEIAYHKPDLTDKAWNGFQAVFIISDSLHYNYGFHNDDQAVLSEPTLIFSDCNVPLVDNMSCNWTIKTPSTEWLLAVEMLSYNFIDGEELCLSGTLQDIASTRNWSKYSADEEQVIYYNSPIYLDYSWLQMNEGELMPSFNLLVTPMQQILTKNCSLSFHNKTFTADYGEFTNIRPFQTYVKNEKCQWSVSVPSMKTMRIKFVKNDAGVSSGDVLAISSLQYNFTHFSSLFGFEERIVVYKSQEATEVIFTWETDGAYEYNGFALQYTISGAAEIRLSVLAVCTFIYAAKVCLTNWTA